MSNKHPGCLQSKQAIDDLVHDGNIPPHSSYPKGCNLLTDMLFETDYNMPFDKYPKATTGVGNFFLG